MMRSRVSVRHLCLLSLGTLCTGLPDPAAAVQQKSTIVQIAGTAGLIGVAAWLDPLVRVDNPGGGSSLLRGVARYTGYLGEYGTATLALGGTWLLSGSDTRRAVGRVARAAAVTGAVTRLLKIYIGRSRPVVSQHGPHFEHLRLDSRHNSFPSGHTALAFALARAIDDEIDNRFLEVGLYSLGTVVGWSRVQQDEHWLSDVTAGAIAGITVTRMLRDGHLLPRDARVDFRPGGVGVVFPVDF